MKETRWLVLAAIFVAVLAAGLERCHAGADSVDPCSYTFGECFYLKGEVRFQ